jgi:hypothetical protein
MRETFRCGHPRTPENIKKSASTGARCRICAATFSRERPRPWRGSAEAIPLSPSESADKEAAAHGSRQLLRAYARYYENHVKSGAA